MTIGVALATAALVGLGIAGFVVYYRSTGPKRALANDLDERLAAALGPGTGSHLEQAPTVRRLAVVDSHDRDEEPTIVPIIRIDLRTTDAPGMRLVFEYVADAVEAIHPTLAERGKPVHHYDIEFTFGPSGLIVAGECRRVSVPPALADRLLEDDRYGAFELWQDVKRGDREVGAITTLWGECTDGRRMWAR